MIGRTTRPAGRPARWLLAPLLVVALSGCGAGELLGAPKPIATDQAALDVVRDRLGTAVKDLDALPTLAVTVDRGSTGISDCTRDSGGPSQPSATREWALEEPASADDILEQTPEARAAGEALADELATLGWVRTEPEMTPAGQIFLRKQTSGFALEGSVSVFNDVIFVSAVVPDLVPCTEAA